MRNSKDLLERLDGNEKLDSPTLDFLRREGFIRINDV